MIQRRAFLAGMAAAMVVPRAAEPQQAGKLPLIAVLGFGPPGCGRRGEAGGGFYGGLAELGWKEELNFRLERRCSNGDSQQTRLLASELVNVNPDVIVVWSSLMLTPVAAITKSTPVVFIGVADPVGSGFIASLSRPGGNLTGVSHVTVELIGKRLELLKEVVPNLSRLGVLSNPTNPTYAAAREQASRTATALGLRSYFFDAADDEALVAAFAAMAKQRIAGLLVQPDSMFWVQRHRLAGLAATNRIPTVFESVAFTAAGGLLAYGSNAVHANRKAATYVDRILKGARPGDLPVEQPTQFELAINLKTAKALGLTIPPSLLLRADQVIE